jgi:hypothetical protein
MSIPTIGANRPHVMIFEEDNGVREGLAEAIRGRMGDKITGVTGFGGADQLLGHLSRIPSDDKSSIVIVTGDRVSANHGEDVNLIDQAWLLVMRTFKHLANRILLLPYTTQPRLFKFPVIAKPIEKGLNDTSNVQRFIDTVIQQGRAA